jgi:Xaa-Pro aminopeptidase
MAAAPDQPLGLSYRPGMHEVAGYRHVQRLAYDAATDVASTLTAGVTEREAAARLEEALRARGVERWFHAPFAWFGERSRFEGFERSRRKFFPSDARLEPGMVGILDVAPIVDGHTGDIGYTFRCPGGGADPEYDRALATLREVRALIPARIGAGDTMRAIYLAVDRLLADRGFDSRHALYPFGVLGHRIERMAPRARDPRIGGFGLAAALQLVGGQLVSRLPGVRRPSPLWTAESERRPEPGLWSMEPHLGARAWGAKFEELLVVEERGAAWLDDDLPHVRAAA